MVKAVLSHVSTRNEIVLTFPAGTEPRQVLRQVREEYPSYVFIEFHEKAAQSA